MYGKELRKLMVLHRVGNNIYLVLLFRLASKKAGACVEHHICGTLEDRTVRPTNYADSVGEHLKTGIDLLLTYMKWYGQLTHNTINPINRLTSFFTFSSYK
jgi:hypothetical protein